MRTRGDVLREQLEQTRTTQHELSRLTGVPQSRISTYVNNRVGLSDEMLANLLAPLGLTVRHSWVVEPLNLTREEHRSWLFHRRLSDLLEAHLEEWLELISSNLRSLREGTRGEPHLSNIGRWERMIEARDIQSLRHTMLAPTRDGVEMREVSPFAGCLPETDRLRILKGIGR